MPVAKHSRLARRVQPIGVNQRMMACRDHLHMFQFGAIQTIGDELCRARDIVLMLRQRADAGYAQQIEQLI
jgi:hypothetical protein